MTDDQKEVHTVTEIVIDESLGDDGEPRQMVLVRIPTNAGQNEARLRVVDHGVDIGMVSAGVLAGIMARYGRPLDNQVAAPARGLDLGGQRSIGRVQFRAAVDAASRDYVVWRAPDREPLAALGRQLATALRYLLERANKRR